MQIGFIGLGALGSALATRVVAQYPTIVWDINSAAVEQLVSRGATAASSPDVLGRVCDVVILCLPRSSNVHDVLLGKDGIVTSLRAGALIIDQTSGVPGETRAIAETLKERHINLVDAPVSGNPMAVAEGKATIIVSGPDSGIEIGLPILRAITGNVHLCSSRVGDAQALKLVNNTMNAACRVGTLECVAMARKAGMSLRAITSVLRGGPASSRITQVMLPAMCERKPSTKFAMALMVKDLSQSLELGAEHWTPQPIAGLTKGVLQSGLSTLGSQAQLEDVVQVVGTMAGVDLLDDDVSEVQSESLDQTSDDLIAIGAIELSALVLARISASHDVRQVHLSPGQDGAEAHLDERAVAEMRRCDVLIVDATKCQPLIDVLSAGPALEPGTVLIALGEDKVPGRMHELSLACEGCGVHLVDAVFSRHQDGSINTLEILCGGLASAPKSARTTLMAISATLRVCGAVGSAHIAGRLLNAIAAINLMIGVESLAMGLRAGLTATSLAAVLPQSSGSNAAADWLIASLARRHEQPMINIRQISMDLRRALQAGTSLGSPMLLANLASSLLTEANLRLGERASFTELARLS